MCSRLAAPVILIVAAIAAWFIFSDFESSDIDTRVATGEPPALQENAPSPFANENTAQERRARALTTSSTATPSSETSSDRSTTEPGATTLLQGRVFDEQRSTPLPSAEIVIAPADAPASKFRVVAHTHEADATSGPRGTYRARLAREPGQMHWVAAQLEGYFTSVRLLDKQNVVLRDGAPIAAGFDLALIPKADAVTVRGRVVTPDGRAPESVTLVHEASIAALPEFGVSHRLEASIDEHGRFEWNAIPPGRARLHIACAGYHDIERDFYHGRRNSIDLGTFKLRPKTGPAEKSATLRGVVRTTLRGPMRDATITVGAGPRTQRTQADRLGHYRIDEIPPGRHNIVIAAPERASFYTSIDFAEGANEELNYRFPDNEHFLAGRVVDLDDPELGLEGVSISCSTRLDFTRGSPPRPARGERTWVTKSGADGAFRINALPAGSFDLHLDWSEGAYRNVTIRGCAADRDDHILRFPMPRGVDISGHIRDSRGSPIAGAHISPAYGRLASQARARSRSAADGSYSIRVPLTNQQAIRIRIQSTGFTPAERAFRLVDASEGRKIEWDTTLYRESELGAISGVIRAPNGSPVEGARVRTRNTLLQPGSAYVASDARGRFTLRDLRAGAYEIEVDEPAHRRATRRVEVAPSQVSEVAVALEALRHADLSVRILEATRPFAGQELIVYSRHPRQRVTGKTDAAGVLHLPKWARVPATIWVRGSERVRSQTALFDLGKLDGTQLELQLRRGAGSIHGKVVTAGGQALPAELVACHQRGGTGLRIHSERATDAEGRFRFDQLPDGEYWIDIAGDARHRTRARPGGPALRLQFLR